MGLSIDELIRRVEVIAEAYAPEEKKSPKSDEKVDEFTAKKREVSKKIKAVRFDLKERELLLEKNADPKRTAEMSQHIRSVLKSIQEDIDELSAIQKKEAKRARKKSPEIQQAVASRGEIVELAYKHLQECENWEKRRITDQMISDRNSLMSGSSTIPLSRMSTSVNTTNPFETYDPTSSNLTDMEDFSDQFNALRNQRNEIDEDLDYIAEGVAKLKKSCN